jgi:hypothetical protein
MKNSKKPKKIKKNSLEQFLDKKRKSIKQLKKEKIVKNKKTKLYKYDIVKDETSHNAVAIIGFPEYALSNIDNIYNSIIKNNKAKVFAHIWINGYETLYDKLKDSLDKLGAYYKFDKQDREKYNTDFVKGCWFNNPRPGPLSFPPNVFGQFDSAKRVMNMIAEYNSEKNNTIKWVFKTRFDTHFEHSINISNSSENLGKIHAKPNPFPWFFQDFSFYGDYKSMKIWGKAYNNIENIYKNHGAAFNQESIWSKFWEINGIQLIGHNEWRLHVIKRKEGCKYCMSINNEIKPYNSNNSSLDKWLCK